MFIYCTINVSFVTCCRVPDLATTLRLYVPGGVVFENLWASEFVPPQPTSNSSMTSATDTA